MKLEIHKPSKRLAPYIKHFWMLESDLAHEGGYVHRIVPNGLFELTFYFGDSPNMLEPSKHTISRTQFKGQLKEYFDIKIDNKLSLFSIYFKPQGVSSILNLPIGEIYDEMVPMEDLFGKDSERLEDELYRAKTFGERIKIAEKFLINRLCNFSQNSEFDRMNFGVKIINRTKGRVKIEELASACCLGRRQFERVFLNNIGISPKHFTRIVRFQNAIDTKAKYPNTSLTQIAYECGYFDQAHMILDFNALSGLTPKQYFAECEPFSDYFLE